MARRSSGGTPVSLRSVQEEFVRAREIESQMLCLASPSSPTKRRYVAVIGVDGVNMVLKSREEQQAILATFRALVGDLTPQHPLQLLVRLLPFDLDAYGRQFTRAPEMDHPHEQGEEAEEPLNAAFRDLLLDAHLSHLRSIEAQRGGLIQRSFYLIFAADLEDELPGSLPALFARLRPRAKQRRHHHEAEIVTTARQQLTVRTEALLRQLASMGLSAHRLSDGELQQLYASCVMAAHALQYPLPVPKDVPFGRPLLLRDEPSTTSLPAGSEPACEEPRHLSTGTEGDAGIALAPARKGMPGR